MRAAVCIIDKEAESLKGQHREPASNTSLKFGRAHHVWPRILVWQLWDLMRLSWARPSFAWSFGIPTEKNSADLSGELLLYNIKINRLQCLVLMNSGHGGKNAKD